MASTNPGFKITDRRDRPRRERPPLDVDVYDAYPALMTAFMTWAAALDVLQLPALAQANARIASTHAIVVPGQGTVPVDPEVLDKQRRLIAAALVFRQDVVAILDESVGLAAEAAAGDVEAGPVPDPVPE